MGQQISNCCKAWPCQRMSELDKMCKVGAICDFHFVAARERERERERGSNCKDLAA